MRAVLIAALFLAATTARAQDDDRSALLAQANQALTSLDYAAAYELFEKLEKRGGASPAQLAEIYERLGEIAASIRQPELAVRQYQKLFALNPEFKLPDDAPEVFRTAVEEAKPPLSPLLIDAVPDTTRRGVNVVIARDSLRLVGTVAISQNGVVGAKRRRSGGDRFYFEVSSSEATAVLVHAYDAYGNELQRIGPTNFANVERPAKSPANKQLRWHQRPSVWLGGAAAISAGATVWLGLSTRSRQDRVNEIAADSSNFTLADLRNAQDKLDSRVRWTNIALVTTGLLAAASATSYFLLDPRLEAKKPAVSVGATTRAAWLSVQGNF